MNKRLLTVEVRGAHAEPDWSKAVAQGDGQPPVLPLVCQSFRTGQVLMLGYVSAEAWQQTLQSGEVVFWSRSRAKLWKKGETSGHFLKVKSLFVDCDADTILALVDPQGPTCHRNSETCFDEEREQGGFEGVAPAWGVLAQVHATLVQRAHGSDPESYTYKLMQAGADRVLRKLGEECTEAILAAKNLTITGDADEFVSESADLLYHWLVSLVALKVEPEQVLQKLRSRIGASRRVAGEKI
ncbi:MAG: bifunctional phosphoribosyl-AMP cyclohydrolase/phosphoribosyl-ATP diphosphatase HisIE [Betaproteobacteria bacterium]|nr:bifunctional phosphoribosyl-AMP cyclohydrolase/phosphoribosyl-ATP diphosphatase HisIE [Betaproteobacteria bacterium]